MGIKKAGWPSFLMSCIMVYDIINEENLKFTENIMSEKVLSSVDYSSEKM